MKKKPIKLLTLDTETYNGLIGGLKRIAVYDGLKVTYGYKFEDVEILLKKYFKDGYNPICYIHNLEFDARKIPQIFDKSRINWTKCFAIKGKLGRISCKEYTFVDSFKILPMSLSTASKDFDVEHGKLDLWEEVCKIYPKKYKDIVDFLDRCDVNDPLFLQYLGYDVMSLYEVLQKLIEVSGLTLEEFTKCNTTASLSRYIFKKGYKGKVFKNPKSYKTDYEILCSYDYTKHKEEEDFLRAAYCGGRTEVFTPILDKPGYHYDLNSPYPFVCMQDMPIGKPKFLNCPQMVKDFWERWTLKQDVIGYMSCEIFIPMQNIPPLPCKMGKLTFPCGTVYGTWELEELLYAVKNCGVEIIKFYEVMYYTGRYPVFKNFVETMYVLKQEADIAGNLALRTFAKLLLNVAYGYTGMRRDDKTKLDSIDNLTKYDKEDIVNVNEKLGFIEIRQEVKSKYIQVAVAAKVTAGARLLLLDSLLDADKKGTVYYADTDSVVTDKPLDDCLIDAHALGKFKLESKPQRAIFLQPKVYAELFAVDDGDIKKCYDKDGVLKQEYYKDADGRIYKTAKKFKGVSKDTQRAMTFYDYISLLADFTESEKDEVIVERDKIVLRSISYMQKKGLAYDTYEVREKKIRLHAGQKRLMDYQNNRTVPHFFKNVEDFENFNYTIEPIVPFNFTEGGE